MATSAPTLTATKVMTPEPPHRHLDRERLVHALDSAIEAGRGFILVSAPAGAGKSTLLSGWLGRRDRPAAWLQIDEHDDDPARYWAFVAGALGSIVPSMPDAVAAALGDGPDAVVAAVVNEVAAVGSEMVLVLDDYHLVTNPDVHRSVERLIALRPTNLVIVLATRVDPPFRLGRLRVREQMAEIRGADLRFELDEAEWLLDADSVGLDHDAVDRLNGRAEGWAAGLVLAGLSLRDGIDVDEFVTSFHGGDQLIADYLSEEFLDSLPDRERQRLLEVSILERMSGPLIDEVCGTDDGTTWLRSLADRNQLVIALDRTGTWFRLHHLLRDVLRLELDRQGPERSNELHAAAGRWHAEAGELATAVDHYLDSDRHDVAADLVADHATQLLNIGRTFTVSRYIERLGDLVNEHEGLAIVHGWVSFVTGRFAEAERSLEIAARLDADGNDAGLIQSLGAMIQLAKGDVAAGLDEIRHPAPTTEPTHPMVLGGVRVMAGMFDEARPFLDQANEMAATRPDHFVAAVTPVFEAIAEIETGRLDAARDLAQRSIEYATAHRIAEAPQIALAHSVMARTTNDDSQAVTQALRGVQLARRSPEYVMLIYALASAADVGFAHEHADAEGLLLEARTIIDRCTDPGIAGRYLARVESRHGRTATVRTPDLVEPLSNRELAVLRYLPSQLSQREIAGELYVSLNTVKTHCKAIYRKLGVDGRKPAVQAARDHGLL
ncbi:MAG: LuxR C-terminal-related transcriptional regulator [Ilumatobacteraceae bacterium]